MKFPIEMASRQIVDPLRDKKFDRDEWEKGEDRRTTRRGVTYPPKLNSRPKMGNYKL